MPEREFHPISIIFTMMTNDEFKELCDDIREHGLMQPIVLLDEKNLDGRNRDRACLHVGVEPEYVVYTGNDPISYVAFGEFETPASHDRPIGEDRRTGSAVIQKGGRAEAAGDLGQAR